MQVESEDAVVEDCVICLQKTHRVTSACGCQMFVHQQCLQAWKLHSKRSCVLLCGVKRTNDFEEALLSLLTVISAWMIMCAIISIVGMYWITGVLHAASGLVCLDQRRRRLNSMF